jgi:hypothetical protein
MAVQFPDASNRVNWNAVIGTTGALTLSMRVTPTGGLGTARLLDFNEIFFLAAGTTQARWERSYSTQEKICQFDSIWTLGTEVHIVVTDDGTTNATGIAGYANGSLLTHTSGQDVDGIGGAVTDDYFQICHSSIAFPATFSEIAVWHRVLSATEIASLSAGRCSPAYFPNALKAYMPLWDIGASSGLREHVRNLSGTITTGGIAKATHPRTHYPVNPALPATEAGGTSLSVGVAVETDTALARPLSKRLAAGVAVETDTALGVALSKRLAAGVAVETDTAFALGLTVGFGASAAVETDTALACALSKRLATGLATETDTALALDLTSGLAPGVAVETDTALARPLSKRLATGLAVETDTALARPLSKRLATGVSAETSVALGRALRKAFAPGLATETDTALARMFNLRPGVAVETDTALALALSSGTAYATERLRVHVIPLTERVSVHVIPLTERLRVHVI